ncbi:MAG: Fe-S cluster assembly sulfur transfer protein SufU [Arenicellales bacterium WSBS_2016_MAG_OTU3]
MSDLRELYQEVIFDHNRNPRNFGKLENANRMADGFNPLCGDAITLYMIVDDANIIQDLCFEGKGCAISTASASIMTETLKGKTLMEAEKYFTNFHNMATGTGELDEELEDADRLQVLGGVRQYPARIKCATLAWHTATAALHRQADPVTTE